MDEAEPSAKTEAVREARREAAPESAVSAVTVLLVTARAVNIVK